MKHNIRLTDNIYTLIIFSLSPYLHVYIHLFSYLFLYILWSRTKELVFTWMVALFFFWSSQQSSTLQDCRVHFYVHIPSSVRDDYCFIKSSGVHVERGFGSSLGMSSKSYNQPIFRVWKGPGFGWVVIDKKHIRVDIKTKRDCTMKRKFKNVLRGAWTFPQISHVVFLILLQPICHLRNLDVTCAIK